MSIIQLMGSGDMLPAADPNASSLVTALPFNLKYGFSDQSYRIRGTGSPASVKYESYAFQPPATISTARSKFYGSSLEEARTSPAGTTFHLSELEVDTGSANVIGAKDYCYECWFYTEDFLFAGQVQYTINYNLNSNGALGPSAVQYDVPQIVVKGDNWPNIAQFQRGIRLGNGPTQAVVFETSAQCLATNTWHHIAVTRSGSTGRIFVDGILRATGTDSYNYTGYINIHGVCNRTLGSGLYLQDLRVYVGTAKYTSNFTPPGAMFV